MAPVRLRTAGRVFGWSPAAASGPGSVGAGVVARFVGLVFAAGAVFVLRRARTGRGAAPAASTAVSGVPDGDWSARSGAVNSGATAVLRLVAGAFRAVGAVFFSAFSAGARRARFGAAPPTGVAVAGGVPSGAPSAGSGARTGTSDAGIGSAVPAAAGRSAVAGPAAGVPESVVLGAAGSPTDVPGPVVAGSVAGRGRGAGGTSAAGVGGWKRTLGAAPRARLRGGAWFVSSPASVDGGSGVGGGLKVGRGERLRRALAGGSRRGGSLGGCSCISMERSRGRDLAHGDDAAGSAGCRYPLCPRRVWTCILGRGDLRATEETSPSLVYGAALLMRLGF
ncbi:hypothetical protein TPA0908_04580 [Micromonospora sp. AKA38]|nr:hypothetical protein TPA0908_04580 [Micromonospora sp. AKA38]